MLSNAIKTKNIFNGLRWSLYNKVAGQMMIVVGELIYCIKKIKNKNTKQRYITGQTIIKERKILFLMLNIMIICN